jgi:hypothetical protein
MFSAIVVALNNLSESQRSLRTGIDALLPGKPHMALTNVTALLQDANLNLSPAEAGLNSGPNAASTPRLWIAGPMLLMESPRHG